MCVCLFWLIQVTTGKRRGLWNIIYNKGFGQHYTTWFLQWKPNPSFYFYFYFLIEIYFIYMKTNIIKKTILCWVKHYMLQFSNIWLARNVIHIITYINMFMQQKLLIMFQYYHYADNQFCFKPLFFGTKYYSFEKCFRHFCILAKVKNPVNQKHFQLTKTTSFDKNLKILLVASNNLTGSIPTSFHYKKKYDFCGIILTSTKK